MNARLIVVLGLVGLVVLFIIQNVVVEICFLFWSLEMSRTLLMFLLLAVGVIIGWFLHGYASHRKAGRGQVLLPDSQLVRGAVSIGGCRCSVTVNDCEQHPGPEALQ